MNVSGRAIIAVVVTIAPSAYVVASARRRGFRCRIGVF